MSKAGIRNSLFFQLIGGMQTFGIGFYMVRRRLFALASTAGVAISVDEPLLSALPCMVGYLIIILVNRKTGWVPSRHLVMVSGVICSIGLLCSQFSDSWNLVGVLVEDFFTSVLTIYFGMVLCSMPAGRQLPTLTTAMLVNLASIAVILLFFKEYSFYILMVLYSVIGFLLAGTKDDELIIGQQCAHAPDATRRSGIIILAAIAVGYIMCSILNGLAPYEYFSLTSRAGLLTYCIAGFVVIVALYLVKRFKLSNLDSLLARFWPLLLVLLLLGLMNFSSVLPLNQELTLTMAFSGLNLFYFASWIICPLIIARYGLPVVTTYGIMSILCTGYFWRQLGGYLSTLGITFFSMNLFGLLTTFIVILLLVAAVYRETKELSAPLKQVEPVIAHVLQEKVKAICADKGLSEREGEVVLLTLQGYSASKVADKLFITENTVRFHLRNIYRKFGIHSKQQLLDVINGCPDEHSLEAHDSQGKE